MYTFTVLVLLLLLCLFVCFILAFCHVDIDVCIYSTCAFLIVKWILMLILYRAASS